MIRKTFYSGGNHFYLTVLKQEAIRRFIFREGNRPDSRDNRDFDEIKREGERENSEPYVNRNSIPDKAGMNQQVSCSVKKVLQEAMIDNGVVVRVVSQCV